MSQLTSPLSSWPTIYLEAVQCTDVHVLLGGLRPPSTQSCRPRFPHAMPRLCLLSTSSDKHFSLQQPALPPCSQGRLLCVSSCATHSTWFLLQACNKYLKLIYSVRRVWHYTQNKIFTLPYNKLHYLTCSTFNYMTYHMNGSLGMHRFVIRIKFLICLKACIPGLHLLLPPVGGI